MPGNMLAHETSPYLLQHKDNPVAWLPWSAEALALARREDRPILLSVGYAACHWCHVMAHECFENPEIAAQMNALYVNIKVDREERPDLDAIYQHALALMGEQGGWPLTMFLTPEREPFWGGTYFPPAPRFGRPGFPEVLETIHRLYKTRPKRLQENVSTIRRGLHRLAQAPGRADIDLPQLDRIAGALHRMMDMTLGGLQGAPKFPQTALFEAIWRAHLRTGNTAFAQAVIVTCERMCQGGIYDHLGGGFARYSTDPLWLAPHFEKMLYDNAQLLDLLTLVWQGTGMRLFETRIRETVTWLLREMIAESGAFAATIDADSEGEEGRFYVWTEAEIDAVLGADAHTFKAAYDVSAGGNWEGRNILNRLRVPTLGSAEEEAKLPALRERLRLRRESRPHPGRDDKVLADWNGMMIAALAQAGAVFGEPHWRTAAVRAFDAVTETMGSGARLHHSWRKGAARHAGMLEDYANMARAALVLFETEREPRFLDHAVAWADTAETRFADPDAGGYFQTADDVDDVIIRSKSINDSAVPSGNSVMLGVLNTLAALTGAPVWRRRAERLADAFTAQLSNNPAGSCAFMNNLEQAMDSLDIVIVGAPDDPRRDELLRCVRARSLPGRTLMTIEDSAALPPGHPAAGKTTTAGAAAWVCRGAVCSPPAADAEALNRLLQRPRAAEENLR